MTDVTGLAGGGGPRGNVATDPRGYQTVREVERTAAATRHQYPRQTLQAIERLGRALESGEQLRRDVPRGFHLNITA